MLLLCYIVIIWHLFFVCKTGLHSITSFIYSIMTFLSNFTNHNKHCIKQDYRPQLDQLGDHLGHATGTEAIRKYSYIWNLRKRLLVLVCIPYFNSVMNCVQSRVNKQVHRRKNLMVSLPDYNWWISEKKIYCMTTANFTVISYP